MKELLEYRVKMIVRLGEAAREFRVACEAVSDPFEKIEGEWTLHQIASHIRDTEKLVYGARIQRTVNEDNPEFKNFDADAWMREHYNPQEPLKEILDEFIKTWMSYAKPCATCRRRHGHAKAGTKPWVASWHYNCGWSAAWRTSRNICKCEKSIKPVKFARFILI